MTNRRKRYSCCNGSLKCGLNTIERAVDKLLVSYRKNKRKGRQELMNWILDIEDNRDWYKFRAKELLKEKRIKRGHIHKTNKRSI